MRHWICRVIFFLVSVSIYCQKNSFGVKGGLNYSTNQKAAEITGFRGSYTTNSKIGYQVGLFYQWEINNLYLRPEVYYALTQGEFPFPAKASLYAIEKLSFPMLLGYRFSNSFSGFAGPAYQYVLSNHLENIKDSLLSQQSNFAAQLGVMFEFDRLQIDLRYDFTFNSPETQQVTIPGVMENALLDDGRLNQFMLSLNYKLFNPDLPVRLKGKNKNCYF